jgi:multiple antibiotic resistance protein
MDEISLSFVFAIFFVTLGPLKIIPPFFFTTHELDQKARLAIALKSTMLAALILFATAFVALALLNNWRVSRETLLTTGGLLLLVGSLRALSHGVPTPPEPGADHPGPGPAGRSPIISRSPSRPL